MSSELLKICEPREWLEPYFLEDVYPDGRRLTEFRGSSVHVGFNATARGSALVKQGGSMVDVSVELEIAVKGDEPQISFQLEAPECMDEVMVDDAHMVLDQFVENKTLANLNAVTANDDRLMWVLKVNIEVLSYDTAYIDTIVTAVSAALLNTKVPEVRFAEEVDEDAPIELSKAIITDKWYPFQLVDIPVSSGFAVYKTSITKEPECLILADPIAEVSDLIVAKCVLVVGYGENIHSMVISGGEPIDADMVKKFHTLAKTRHQTVSVALRNIAGRLLD
ncbi:hypothetical protein QR680_012756 [Steinernema hermaphroditum]|uniref:Ribosomal RNA-processing protein 43 n=1 Tax=Steinernema hermaphroditum TaxID=289476 RepID=A0AA39I327_9BILA|nr:hypothetical protein QR680_012756 [Steinernema hermaphroditum]